MDAANGRLVADVFERLSHLSVCGRADGWNVVLDGMLRRNARKSALYAGELVPYSPAYNDMSL